MWDAETSIDVYLQRENFCSPPKRVLYGSVSVYDVLPDAHYDDTLL